MENKTFTIFLIVILGIILAAGIVAKQSREPLLRDMVSKQTQILEAQMRMEKSVGPSQKIQDLENRLAALEAKLKILEARPAAPQPQPQPEEEDFSKVYEIPVADSYVIGKKDAPVTIVEFVDFQCPFCSRFHPPAMEALKQFPEQVNLLIKNFPLSFHPQARPAAKAALAAGEQGKYAEMADALFANNTNLSDAKFEELAKNLGLDVKKFLDDYKNKDAQWEKIIQADMDLGAQVGVRGTPTFYLNGRKSNARDAATWKTEIEQILKEK